MSLQKYELTPQGQWDKLAVTVYTILTLMYSTQTGFCIAPVWLEKSTVKIREKLPEQKAT